MICSWTRLSCQVHYTDLRNRYVCSVWSMIQINWFSFITNQTSSLLLNKEQVSVPIFVIAINFFPLSVFFRRKNGTWVWMRMSKVCEHFTFWVNYSSGVLREWNPRVLWWYETTARNSTGNLNVWRFGLLDCTLCFVCLRGPSVFGYFPLFPSYTGS